MKKELQGIILKNLENSIFENSSRKELMEFKKELDTVNFLRGLSLDISKIINKKSIGFPCVEKYIKNILQDIYMS